MSYLYLDESGNLGHEFQSTGVSRHFVITILEIPDDGAKKAIEKAIERTMKNKIRGKSKLQRNLITELKGAKTSFAFKNYFYSQVASVPFKLYAVILDKKRFVNHLQVNENRVYNFVAHLAIKEFPLERATPRVTLVLDRSKSKPEIRAFNQYLLNQLEARLPPQIPLDIFHDDSQKNKPIQAVDLFAWGIYRKYEAGDTEWYEVFRSKIVYEHVYPPK
jgi:hypothetical protein